MPRHIQRHALTPERPAHVADAHEKGRGQPVCRANFHAQQGRLAAKTHRADAEFVRGFQNVLLQRVKLRHRIAVGNQPQKLRLAHLVARCTVAADAHAENARTAAFALRLQHRVENHFAATIKIAICMEFFVRQGILGANVFAAAAFEREFHGNFFRAMLMKMKRRRAGTAVRAVVFTGERIHRILAQITFLGRELHGFARGFGKGDLIEADRTIHVKQNAAGVLADRLRFVFGDGDVLVNDLHRVLRDGALLLIFQRGEDGLMDVIGNFGGGAADEFDEGILQLAHKFESA